MSDHIRTLDLAGGAPEAASEALGKIYDDALDAVILRRFFPAESVAMAQSALAANVDEKWYRPNKSVLGIDIRLIGKIATPTIATPTGPGERDYFDAVAHNRLVTRQLFSSDFDPFDSLESGLAMTAGGRPVELATHTDGRRFAACSVRSLRDGQGILLHDDYHYRLPFYSDLAPRLDTTTCISFFVVLQRPTNGGRLCVYALKPGEEGDLPRLPHGLLDQQAVDATVPYTFFDLQDGDLIAFGSGRLYHRIEPVVGARSRVTMGGFLAFDATRERVLYWS